MSTDPLFMRDQSGEYFWYHNDHLGTPQMMTTSSGAVVWKAKYTAFGKATVDSSSTVVNPLRLPGQYEDIETGLHYNWWRFYNVEIGRYLRADPIGFDGGVNFFQYCFANPIIHIDFSGLNSGSDFYFRKHKDGDWWIWDFSPGYEVFIKPIGYMFAMRYKFKQEYKRRIEFCKKMYPPESRCGFTKSNFNTCVEYYQIFEYYSENYGYWHSMFNSMFWSVDENFERLKKVFRPVEHDIFYYWDGENYRPTYNIN